MGAGGADVAVIAGLPRWGQPGWSILDWLRLAHPQLRGLRSFPVGSPFENVLIFYRATDEALDAVRLMHGARNLPRRLQEATA